MNNDNNNRNQVKGLLCPDLLQPGSISIQLLEREVEVLKRVHHDSIIQLEAVYETAKVIKKICVRN